MKTEDNLPNPEKPCNEKGGCQPRQTLFGTTAYVSAAAAIFMIGILLVIEEMQLYWDLAVAYLNVGIVIAVVLCAVSSTVALRSGRSTGLIVLKWLSLAASAVMMVAALATIIFVGCIIFGSSKSVGPQKAVRVAEIYMMPLYFEGFDKCEVEMMDVRWLRAGVIIDSCALTDVYDIGETGEKTGGFLWFSSSAMSDEVFPTDTIFFTSGQNVYKLYDITWHTDGGGYAPDFTITDGQGRQSCGELRRYAD